MAKNQDDTQVVDAQTSTTTEADGIQQPISATSALVAPPTTEQLAEAPNWGQGGRYIINSAGNRVPATDKE